MMPGQDRREMPALTPERQLDP